MKKNIVYYKSSENMNEIENETIDLIITSPPYFNIKDYSKDGKQLKKHSKINKQDVGSKKDYIEYIQNLLKIWKECYRVLKPNGKLCINVPLLPMVKKEYSTHENRHIFDLQSDIQKSILSNLDLFLYDIYIWNRKNSTKKIMFGSYPYPNNFYNQNIIEFITIFVKPGKRDKISKEIKEKSKLSKNEWVKFTKQIWDIPIPNKSDLAFGEHSAIMPEEIPYRLIKMFSFVGDTILDPFSGSGTTLKIAKELNRNYIGYELYKNYENVINQKLNQKQNEIKILKNPINKIIAKDVFKALLEIQDESIDLIIADPPYNLSVANWDTFESEEKFFEFSKKWIEQSIKKLKLGGSFYFFNNARNSAKLLEFFEDCGLIFKNWIVWYKKDGFSSNKKKFNNAQETILFFTKGNKYTFNTDDIRVPYESKDRIYAAKKTGITKNGKKWFPNEKGKLCTDVWEIVSERHKNKINGKLTKQIHPTIKPEELIERIIKASSNKQDIVLDLFSGTGTTSFVCLKNDRKFIAIENDKNYVKIINERLKNVK